MPISSPSLMQESLRQILSLSVTCLPVPLCPGLLLVLAYGFYVFVTALIKPELAPAVTEERGSDANLLVALLKGLFPPVVLMIAVLGSILMGLATPTEAASVGAIGAMLLAAGKRMLSMAIVHEVAVETTRVTSMVYLILVGATIFSSVFAGSVARHD